jgi:hypothetical protein
MKNSLFFKNFLNTFFLKGKKGYLYFLLLLGISGCDLTPVEEIQINQLNTVFFGNQPLDFVSARLTVTGPIAISGPNSHYRARLELSTDIAFREPFIANSSVLSLEINSLNKGVSLPTFPLEDGEFIVFPYEEITDQDILSNLSDKNFTLGPRAGINFVPSQSEFNITHEAESGFITIRFDLPTNRVVITHNWRTKSGLDVRGTNNLPINLSQFVP